MIVKINSEEELIKVTAELIHVLANLRKFTVLWESHYGVALKQKKKYYEKRADELIEILETGSHKWAHQIKIEITKQD